MEKDAEETLEQEKRGHKIVTAKILSKSESERKHKRKQAKILRSQNQNWPLQRENTRENKQSFFRSQNQNWPLQRENTRENTHRKWCQQR